MNSNKPIYIHACGIHCALGLSRSVIHHSLQSGDAPGMQVTTDSLNSGGQTVVGRAVDPLPEIPARFSHQNTYNNRLALSALNDIKPEIEHAIARYGRERVAVIVGTSTFGMADGEAAMTAFLENGAFPDDYHYHQQEPDNTAEFIADYFDILGPVYTLSTACTSSARALISAKRLLESGLVDAVLAGGADSLCQLTLNGFHGLDALSSERCNPFSQNRNGINIGEGAAFLLLSREPRIHEGDPNTPHIALLGTGDSSDAHHISAPHPDGLGAERAMRRALADAGLSPAQIGYINAHGTATQLNDAMESRAIARVFGSQVPVSSTKPLTGHTLGAAGAVEAAICWHVLHHQLPLPAQVNDGELGDIPISLVSPGMALRQPAIMSNSFAFGGNNVSLIFGVL